MRLVFFDLDGTLLRGASSERRFMLYLLRHGWIGPWQILAQSLFLLRYASRFGRHICKKNKAYLAGLQCEQVAALAAEFVIARLAPQLFTPALVQLRAHLAAGDRVVLLTGSPDFIARPLANYLSVADVRATICARRNGRFLARPPVQHPFASDKLRIARQMAASAHALLNDASAYADSVDDLALLHVVDEPVAVCPSKRLRSVARARGWPIVDAGPGCRRAEKG